MLNNFIYAQTKDLFLEALGAGNVLDEAIVFIEDTKEIWNHGHYFGQDSQRFKELEDDLSDFIEQWNNSPASTISSSDITNWNNKTSNNGTVTGVKINGSTKNPTNGIVDIGTVITSHQDISGKQNTLISGTNIKTINSQSLLGSGNIDIHESSIKFGNTNITGNITPIDMAMSNRHNPNRLAFGNPDGVVIEYSQDGGATWSVVSAANSQKLALYSGQTNAFFTGNRSTGASVNDQLRITLDAQTMGVYTNPKKLLLNVSQNGTEGVKLKLERAKFGSKSTYETYGTYNISGWSGWNSIPLNWGTFGGSESQTNNWCVMRLTFSFSSFMSGYSGKGFYVSDICLFGSTDWTTPSEMARTGHIYSYDTNQNVTFPGNVKVGKTSADAGTDKTRIYFGDGDYVWIGEYNPADDTSHDDNLTVYSPNGLFIMNDRDSYINIDPYGIYSDHGPILGTSSSRFSNGYFSGALYATQGFFEESDERLKNFEGKINIDLDKLSKLKKNYFTWKNDSNTKQIGVSAQEIMELYPEIVSETEDGILNVAYEKLSVVALAAVDELYKKNQELEERLSKLESILLNKN